MHFLYLFLKRLFDMGCALLGLLIAIVAGTPVGSTIVAVDIAAFLVCLILGKVQAGARP